MEMRFEARQVIHHEAAVLVYRVAAQRRHARRHVLLQEFDQLAVDICLRQLGRFHAFYQAGLRVRVLVPRIHGIEHRSGLMHDHHRPFGHSVEVSVGNDDRHFQHFFDLGVEPAHLHVDPDQVIRVGCHSFFERKEAVFCHITS